MPDDNDLFIIPQSISLAEALPGSHWQSPRGIPSPIPPQPELLPSTAPSSQPDFIQNIMPSALNITIDRIQGVSGLKEALDQVLRGEVAAYREKVGPQKGRKTNPDWARHKHTITRRERLHTIFAKDFKSDRDHFFTFFTKPHEGTGKKTGDNLYSFDEVITVLLPNQKKCIQEEQTQEHYKSNGEFSEELWKEKWGEMNDWEVWMELKSGE